MSNTLKAGDFVRVESDKICGQYGMTGIVVGDVVEVIDANPFPSRDDIILVEYDDMPLIVSFYHVGEL